MIRRMIVLAAALSTAALGAGKLEIFHVPARGAEAAVTGLFEMPAAPVGGSSTAVFRLRNTGDAAINLSSIGCPERWCSMTGQPLIMPYVIAPGLNVDFTIRFSPPDAGSYTATIRYNSSTLLLRGSGIPAVALFHAGQSVQAGGAVDFGALERGQSRTVTLQSSCGHTQACCGCSASTLLPQTSI